MKLNWTLLLSVFCLNVYAAEDFSTTSDKLKSALQSEVRGEADTVRDRNRKPIKTMEFFGFRDDMKVLELIPGGGWYTRILAPTLAESGELYVSIGTTRVEENLLKQPGFEKVKVIPFPRENFLPRAAGERQSGLKQFSFGATGFDMALTFRNLHNFNQAARINTGAAVFKALKAGGLFGVIDHTRRHMQADDNENRRRLDPVLVIKELESVGFELVDYSDLHYKPDDELRYEVGRKTVTGNTDRFTLLFRKPG